MIRTKMELKNDSSWSHTPAIPTFYSRTAEVTVSGVDFILFTPGLLFYSFTLPDENDARTVHSVLRLRIPETRQAA